MSKVVATQKSQAIAQQLSLGGIANGLEWMVDKFGPVLSEVLLELLLKKSQQGVLPVQNDAFGSFDVKSLLSLLVDRFGPGLVEKLAVYLESRDDLTSKVLATVLRQSASTVLDVVKSWLNSPEGMKAVQEVLSA